MFLPILLALALQSAPDAAAPKTAAQDASDTPHGAPTDDYGFVAWCRGALSGHMELYPAVKTELQKVEEEKAAKEDSRYTTDAEREAAVKRRVKEALDDTRLDEEQLAAGRTYLKLYTDAIVAAETASAKNLHSAGEEAQDAGYRIWSAARGAEPRTKMWSWVMWELPARCETSARRLLDRSSLLAGALKPQPLAERTVEAKADLPPVDDAKADDAVKPSAGEPVAKEADKPEAVEATSPQRNLTETKPAEPVPSEAKSDGPVGRRDSAAPPTDAPDAPTPAPKP